MDRTYQKRTQKTESTEIRNQRYKINISEGTQR